MGVSTTFDVEGFFTNVLGKMLVDGNTVNFQSLAGNLLLLVAHQVSDEREQIDWGLLGTNIKNTKLRFWDTTPIAILDVLLILLVAVATSWTTAHLESILSLLVS